LFIFLPVSLTICHSHCLYFEKAYPISIYRLVRSSQGRYNTGSSGDQKGTAMRLSVLADNNTTIDRYFLGEPAVSYHIVDGDAKVLFDVGYSDVFIRNAQRLQIDLLDLDFLAFSHGHLDHTWGLEPLIRLYAEAETESRDHTIPTLIAHPDLFFPKIEKSTNQIGCLISKTEAARHFKMSLTKQPYHLTDHLVFLGEIPRTNSFENKTPIGQIQRDDEIAEDFLLDDTALAYKAKEGLVIISACSHAGICNIIEHAKEVCRDDRILDVIGGFPLLDPDPGILEKTVSYFAQLKPVTMHPCHCTDFQAKVAISKVANIQEVGSGLQLDFD